MKLSFDIDAPDAFCDIIDGVTVVLLKEIRKDAEHLIANHFHKDDVKEAKKRIKAVNVLLDYYGEK